MDLVIVVVRAIPVASAASSIIRNATAATITILNRIGPIAPTDENKLLFSVEGRKVKVASTGAAAGKVAGYFDVSESTGYA